MSYLLNKCSVYNTVYIYEIGREGAVDHPHDEANFSGKFRRANERSEEAAGGTAASPGFPSEFRLLSRQRTRTTGREGGVMVRRQGPEGQ